MQHDHTSWPLHGEIAAIACAWPTESRIGDSRPL